MNQRQIDEFYMRRCLQLAVNGMKNARPNPMVGAVIVSQQGTIIGEGYHAKYGEGHAEVNAFASVRAEDEGLLPHSTVYVSLEPCSHYGKTPPCADLIVRKGVRRVVCGSLDPFAKVHGRGVQKLRDAGIEVTVGVLENECIELNKRFMTFNEKHRPYIILKWAQSLNGLIDNQGEPYMFSNAFTQMLSHKLRAENDAILVGRVTDDRDHPQLTTRYWPGNSPERLVLRHPDTISDVLSPLYAEGKQSLIVEGGAKTLSSFMEADMWDEIRVETAPIVMAGGTQAPALPADIRLEDKQDYEGNEIVTYRRATPLLSI